MSKDSDAFGNGNESESGLISAENIDTLSPLGKKITIANNKTSVKEKIMLFTNNSSRANNHMSPKKLKIPTAYQQQQQTTMTKASIHELSNKHVCNQSSPSINQLSTMPSYQKNSSPLTLKTASSNSFVNNNNNVSKELRKYSSTTTLVSNSNNYNAHKFLDSIKVELPVVSSSPTTKTPIETKIIIKTPPPRATTVVVENLECCESDEDEMNFKSVKDRIAYFSSKLKASVKRASKKTTNLNKVKSNSVLACGGDAASAIIPFVNYSSNVKLNNDHRFQFVNKIETINSNNSMRQQSIKSNASDDYDSLKHAYKLNALANSTSIRMSYF